jgi:hypothetical protein
MNTQFLINRMKNKSKLVQARKKKSVNIGHSTLKLDLWVSRQEVIDKHLEARYNKKINYLYKVCRNLNQQCIYESMDKIQQKYNIIGYIRIGVEQEMQILKEN